jgi:hypothetical protein
MQQQDNQHANENKNANRGHGPQGIDKAPGEEPSEDNVQFTQETQKGKKVDADPTQESDRPAEQTL